jgi:glycosyltransferase involved in cell wall biosynthesis
MKISINVVSPFESGGFNTYNKYLVNNIAKLDKKNYYYIYVDYNNFKNYQIYQPNIKIIKKSQLLNNSALRIIWMQFILPFSLIYNQVDIHVSTMNISPLFLKLSRTKSILIQHSNLPWVYPNEFSKNLLKLFLTRSLMSLSIYFSDTVICDTNYARNELINFFPRQRDKIKKAYLAVDRKIFKVKSDINNTEDILSKYSLPKKYFLSIASTKPYHKLLELIKAYEIFIKDTEDTTSLVIITNIHDMDYFKTIQTFISKNNLNLRVKIITGISSKDIPSILACAELYIFPSIREVFGLTNIEAMSCGIPVLTSRLSAIPEVCADAAIYFNPHDPEDLKNKIFDLYYDNSKKNDLIKNGTKRAEFLSWENTAKETLKIISKEFP